MNICQKNAENNVKSLSMVFKYIYSSLEHYTPSVSVPNLVVCANLRYPIFEKIIKIKLKIPWMFQPQEKPS